MTRNGDEAYHGLRSVVVPALPNNTSKKEGWWKVCCSSVSPASILPLVTQAEISVNRPNEHKSQKAY